MTPDDNVRFAQQLAAGPAPEGAPAEPEPQGVEPRQDGKYPDDRWIPEDVFQSADPVIQAELKARRKEILAAERREEQLSRQLEEAHQRIMSAPAAGQEPQKKEGWAAFSDAQLMEYDSKADSIVAALAADPDNEALREEAKKINPAHRQSVRQEMMRREIEKGLNQFKEEVGEKAEASAYSQRAESLLVRTMGAEALMESENQPNPILDGARKHARDALAGVLGDKAPSPETLALAELLSVQLAAAEQRAEQSRGSERRDPRLLRNLDLGEQVGRAASASAQRSAALRRGDVGAVFDQDLDAFLDDILA